jgi:hypothetical protein
MGRDGWRFKRARAKTCARRYRERRGVLPTACLRLVKRLFSGFMSDVTHILAGSFHDLGFLLRGQKKYADAEKAYRQALDLKEQLVVESPAEPAYRPALARSRANLGQLLGEKKKSKPRPTTSAISPASWRCGSPLTRMLRSGGRQPPECVTFSGG